MTLTEKNEKLQDLRKKLAWLRTEEMAVEQSIRQINQDYRDQQLFKDKDLFDQMFEVNVG
tara:strand:+ start:452 stop:631 length:180 start_codon:yes stop_codon:yes gene_type:complete